MARYQGIARARKIFQSCPVNMIFRCLMWMLLSLLSAAAADERPSWAVVAAVDRLIAKHALFLPGGDGFVKHGDGKLAQYELPGKSYSRDGKDWRVEILSQRFRKQGEKGWEAWSDARPKYSKWRIGVIRVEVLASGVAASWIEGDNFIGGTAPSESEVRHRLDTQGQSSVQTRR